jgi:hypothetical protein
VNLNKQNLKSTANIKTQIPIFAFIIDIYLYIYFIFKCRKYNIDKYKLIFIYNYWSMEYGEKVF